MRKEFSRDTYAEIVRRATNAAGMVCCEDCGASGLKRGKYQVDHTLADALVLEKKKLKASDGKLLCLPCHGRKTSSDVAIITKAKAQEATRIGYMAPRKKIKSQGFAPTQPKPQRSDTEKGLPRLPPRTMFR